MIRRFVKLCVLDFVAMSTSLVIVIYTLPKLVIAVSAESLFRYCKTNFFLEVSGLARA